MGASSELNDDHMYKQPNVIDSSGTIPIPVISSNKTRIGRKRRRRSCCDGRLSLLSKKNDWLSTLCLATAALLIVTTSSSPCFSSSKLHGHDRGRSSSSCFCVQAFIFPTTTTTRGITTNIKPMLMATRPRPRCQTAIRLNTILYASPASSSTEIAAANTTTASSSSNSKKKPKSKTEKEKEDSSEKTPKPKRRKRAPKKASFSVMFQRLKEYQQQHGHCLVSASDGDEELHKWTRSIRKNYKHQFTQRVRPKKQPPKKNKKKRKQQSDNDDDDDESDINESDNNKQHKTRRPMLSESKAKLLESINFVWDLQETIWEQRYQQLQHFFEENGHANIPFSAEDPTLAIWVQNQRRDYRLWLQDLPSPLTPERLEALEELGIFDDYKSRREAWAQHYQYLVEYHQANGNVNVPQQYMHPVSINVINDHDELETRQTFFALGQWCMNQRTARREWEGLQDEQDLTDAFEEEQKSKKTKKRSSNKSKKSKTKSLSKEEKALENSGRGTSIMTSERIRLLDALDFSWNVRDAKWNNMLDRLQEYYQTHGHLKIPTHDAQNQDLRTWLNFQRHYYQRQRQPSQSSPMTEDRIEAMEEAIPDFQWKANSQSGPSVEDWTQLFAAMRDKGIAPGMRPKQHWFEGINPLKMEVKQQWTEQELIDLWNQESDDDDEDLGDINMDYNLDDDLMVEKEEMQMQQPSSNKNRKF